MKQITQFFFEGESPTLKKRMTENNEWVEIKTDTILLIARFLQDMDYTVHIQ